MIQSMEESDAKLSSSIEKMAKTMETFAQAMTQLAQASANAVNPQIPAQASANTVNPQMPTYGNVAPMYNNPFPNQVARQPAEPQYTELQPPNYQRPNYMPNSDSFTDN